MCGGRCAPKYSKNPYASCFLILSSLGCRRLLHSGQNRNTDLYLSAMLSPRGEERRGNRRFERFGRNLLSAKWD